ncbi:oligosaccharide flippase family protein [Scandinavium sp.]|uniref:lipopolysaccharide biosynthesis protein n=1 Tax=Scandinavium sp. TaxID=2830653 RepID=UPI00289D8B7F|nr:oligosaccharide flippase family protein [Scandinavium sp.]
MKVKSVRGLSAFFVGEMLSKALPFLLLPYLTRVLDPEAFGQLSLFMALSGVFIIAVNWSFEGAISRYYYRYGSRNFTNLIILSIGLIILLDAIFFAIAYAFSQKIILYAIICAGVQSIYNVLSSVQQCQKKVRNYLILQLGNSTISVFCTVAFIEILGHDYIFRVLSIILGLLISILIALPLSLRTVYCKFNYNTLRLNFLYCFSFGFPLILHQASLYVKGQLDRLLVAQTYDLSSLAFYSAAYQVASISLIVIMALNKAGVPYFFEACKKNIFNGRTIRKYFIRILPLSLIPGVILFFIPDDVYSYFLGENYAHISVMVALFTLGMGIQIPYLLLVNYLFYLSENKKIAFCTIITSVAHIGIVLVLKEISLTVLSASLILSNSVCVLLLYGLICNRGEE